MLALGCLCAILSGACQVSYAQISPLAHNDYFHTNNTNIELQPFLAMVSGGIFNLMLVSFVSLCSQRTLSYQLSYKQLLVSLLIKSNFKVTNVTTPEFRVEAYTYVYTYIGMGIGVTIINFINVCGFVIFLSTFRGIIVLNYFRMSSTLSETPLNFENTFPVHVL